MMSVVADVELNESEQRQRVSEHPVTSCGGGSSGSRVKDDADITNVSDSEASVHDSKQLCHCLCLSQLLKSKYDIR